VRDLAVLFLQLLTTIALCFAKTIDARSSRGLSMANC
jgi:hypothetical protein